MEEKERYTIDNFNIYEPSCIFDNKKQQIILTLVDYNYDEIVNLESLLNQQDKRIKELENMNSRLSQGIYWGNGEHFCDVVSKLKKENQQLKQQLHDLPNKIVEEIKEQLFNHFKVKNIEEYEKLPLIDSLFTADTVIEILDAILKKFGGKNEKE